MALPRVNIRRISLDTDSPEYFQCSIDFCTELPNLSMLKPEEFFKNYHILVVQCRSQKQADQLANLTAEALARVINLNAKTNFSDYRVFSVDQKQISNLKDPTVTEKAELCFSTDEVGPFKVKSKNLSHLSYLFVPYFDKDGGRRIADFGIPTVEIVYEKGKKKTKALALVDKNTGQPHEGRASPTPQTIAGTSVAPVFTAAVKDKKGAINGQTKELQIVEVPNITIQDNRIWEELKIDSADFLQIKSTLSKNPAPTAQDPVKDVSELSDEKKSYFSEISFSKADDASQSNKIFFSVNFKGMAKAASLYPWLFENSSFSEELARLTKIESIKLYRRLYFNTPAQNSLGMPSNKGAASTEEKIHLVASSTGKNGIVAPKFSSQKEEGQPYEFVGSIKETELISGVNGARSFTATDHKVNTLGGKHQYLAEIEVQEATRSFLKKKLEKITAAASVIKEYALVAQSDDLATKSPYFNEKHRKFLKSFGSRLIGKISRDRILESIEIYLSVSSDLTTKIIDVNVAGSAIWDLIAPDNGTVNNILRLETQINELARKLDDILSGKGKQAVAGSEIQSMSNKNTAPGLTTYKTTFEDVYTSSAQKPGGKNGYKFLPIEEPREDPELTIGPAAITVADYQKAVQVQHDRLFKVEGQIQIAEGVVANIENTKPTFLTPSAIKIDDTETKYAGTAAAVHNVDRANRVVTEKLKHNLGLGSSNRSLKTTAEATTDSDYLTDNLIDLFASKGCTVEGVSSTSYQKASLACYEDTAAEKVEATTVSIVDSVRAPKDVTTLDKEEVGRDAAVSKRKTKSAKGLINLVDILTKEKSPKWKKKGIKESDFNLSKAESSLSALSSRELGELPNQINALMALATSKESENTLNIEAPRLSKDDKENNGFYEENLTNIREVQMLTGYEVVNGEPQMKSPIYKKVKQEDLNSLPAGESVFCRTVKYSRPEVGVTASEDLDFPVFNENFVLKNDNVATIPERIVVPSKTPRTVKKDTIVDRAKIIEPKIDPTRIFTDGNVRGTASDARSIKPVTRRLTPRPKRGRPVPPPARAPSAPRRASSTAPPPSAPRGRGPKRGRY